MDAPENDGSGCAEEESSITSHSFVARTKWRGHAFRAYLPGREPDKKKPKPLRVVVDRTPVVKLTKDILETFHICNATFTYSEAFNPKRYLTNPSVAKSNSGLDNENHDLILAVNGVLVNGESSHRYIVKDLLGQGTFGQVAKCWADERDCFVAVKIIKNQSAYYQQALVEVYILNMLNNKFDPEDSHHIVRILEHFVYHGHLCLVFEMLGVNLFELLKVNQFKGISLNLIRLFIKQILTALAVLRDARVIHCDLKPENILLTTRPASAELKLIDFGSACMEHRTVYSYIQSRFYRSPEVVLGHEYTTSIDMWSFGCVAAELFLGIPLFPAQSQYDLLHRIIQILGSQPPDHILRKAKDTRKYFKHAGAPARQNDCTEGHHSAYVFLSLAEYEAREKERPAIGKHYCSGKLEEIILKYHMKKSMSREEKDRESNKRVMFVDFLKGLFNLDPSKRWTPQQAARHPFVTEEPFRGSFQPPPETPRPPIHQGMTVDHNPVSGHWFCAGLSPQVSSNNPFQYGSPQYSGPPFSCASSYGSAGSYGSFGDGGVGPGSSFGSYGDALGSYVNHRAPSTVGNTGFGISPDTWRRMGHVPPNATGHAHLGLSPSGNSFIPMPLGASPSNFTPSSHFQVSPGSPSTGSPSRYGPTSPARSGNSAVSSLGKAAALGHYNKSRGLGSPGSAANATSGGSRSSGQENPMLPWHGGYQSPYTGNGETSPSSYKESTWQSSYPSSPRSSSIQGSHHLPQARERNGIVAGAQIPNSNVLSYPTGSLGALMSKTQPTSGGGAEDTSPPPNPGDWDPNYSDEQFLQNDGGDTVSSSISALPSMSGVAETEGTQGLNMAPGSVVDPSGRMNHNMHLQGGLAVRLSRVPLYTDGSTQSLQGYGWNAPKPSHHGQHTQQISPSRLGQQPAQLLQQQQQQWQYPYQPSSLHSSEQLSDTISTTQQKINYQIYAQSTFSPADQPFPFHVHANSLMINGEAGGHGLLSSAKRDGRTEHPQVIQSTGNFSLPVGFDALNLGNSHPAVFEFYESPPQPGTHTQDHLNFVSESGSHWVAGLPYSGRRIGASSGALPPPPTRKERRPNL